ncbi:MAG: CRISPR-associated helicase Cas3' [Phototrophicaceae bacterium]
MSSLYPYQTHVRELLREGKNVILQAPTGAGKTRAAIEPFIHSADMKKHQGNGYLPQKLIYSVPMRVLANQFHLEYQEIIKRLNAKRKLELREAIQIGDLKHSDKQLEANLIFATIDQTLSSFLMTPYSLSRGRANVNLGAVLSSYLVFDEFHLYDPDSTLPTVLEMLRMVNGISPFLLMTATFSEVLLTRLAKALNAEVVGLSDTEREEFSRLPSQQKTRRYHTVVSAPLSAEAVLAAHRGRSVVICNTVARARALATQLRTLTQKAEVLLLHSQFLREDRNRIEDHIRARFGDKAPSDGDVILVATQAIEVGVNITSTVMHTELAPANAIVQRAGRCARYEHNEGDVFIYRYSTNADGEVIDLYEDTNPYSGKLERPQLQRTFEVFALRSGDVFRFTDEQAVIDAVHQETDRSVLSDLESNAVTHRNQMYAAMRGDDSSVGNLVRNVIAQPITIHHSPEQIETPYTLPSFNLHPGTLAGYLKTWLTRYHNLSDDTAPSFGVRYLISETNPDDSRKQINRWEEVTFRRNASGEIQPAKIPYGSLVVVHPDLATYTVTEGFIPEHGGEWVASLPDPSDNPKDKYGGYQLETYREHIRLVYKAAFEDDPDINHIAFWREVEWAAKRLADRLKVSHEMMRTAAEMTVLLHDVGKLSTGWQNWVREYQAKIGNPTVAGEAYAHTDRYTPDHVEVERGMGKSRPPHSVESAVAVIELISELPQPLRSPIITAISRHHGAFTSDYKPITFEKNAPAIVSDTIGRPIKALLDKNKVNSFDADHLITPNNQSLDAFFVYALLVRLLRLSDNKGTGWNSPTGGKHD